jgi:hypothetical protein
MPFHAPFPSADDPAFPRSERMVQLFAKGGVPLLATADLMVAKKINSLGMDQRAEMLFSSSSHLG